MLSFIMGADFRLLSFFKINYLRRRWTKNKVNVVFKSNYRSVAVAVLKAELL